MPLHIVFRSSALVVSMLLGWFIHAKVYSKNQIFGVLLVTIGVITTTLVTSQQSLKIQGTVYEWTVGISMLTLSVIVSCLLGHYQEITYLKYGKQWREGLFYTHFLSLPLFLVFFYTDIATQLAIFLDAPTWGTLLLNIITQCKIIILK